MKNFGSDFLNKKRTICFLRQKSFTLAEILIVLGIIGVLAGLTIPPLVENYQKTQTVVGYKKAYSTLQNVVRMSEAENGTIDGWDFPTTIFDNNQAIQFANTYLLPYLSISKKCELNTKCFVTPKRPDGNSTGINYPVQYILNDGMAIEIINYGYSTVPANVGRLNIFVDINGSKLPNTMGKDVFVFVIVQKAAALYNSGEGDLAHNVKNGGVYPDGFGVGFNGINQQCRGCGKDVTWRFSGAYCGMKIVLDGYQIKEDYPW